MALPRKAPVVGRGQAPDGGSWELRAGHSLPDDGSGTGWPGDREVLEQIVEVRGGFGHREHLELAWTYLRMYPAEEAAEAMVAAIRHVAELHDADQKYHETMTRAWLHFVAVHVQRWGADRFDTFLDRNPDLLERNLIHQFYSRGVIQSDIARATWRDPDLRDLPMLV